jgi:hypothetical protein
MSRFLVIMVADLLSRLLGAPLLQHMCEILLLDQRAYSIMIHVVQLCRLARRLVHSNKNAHVRTGTELAKTLLASSHLDQGHKRALLYVVALADAKLQNVLHEVPGNP